MPRKQPHPQTILHLIPKNDKARSTLLLSDNVPFVSLCMNKKSTNDGSDGQLEYGLEIGYHVAAKPRPEVIVEVGRNGDLILQGSSMSSVHFSFEIHPESKAVMFHDRSRLCSTKINPFGFRSDGNFRQLVLIPGVDYKIGAGGEKRNLYEFSIQWMDEDKVLPQVTKDYETAQRRPQNPRWARTVDEALTELPSWYNTRLQTPSTCAIRRTTEGEPIGEGMYGKVLKAIDLDSGCFVAVKTMKLSREKGMPVSELETFMRREVKTLSSISHKNIVEYLGSTGWNTGILRIFTSLKAGNLNDMILKYPQTRTHNKTISSPLHQILEALDYLAFRNLCHRDIKPDNILYTPLNESQCLFQLADFGFAKHQDLAQTYCGTPIYMSPEMYLHKGSQSSKMDVWSLFVTMVRVTGIVGLEEDRLCSYEEVLRLVKTATNRMTELGPMAEENPEQRASAAQMLLKLFNGNGLTTPRDKIYPVGSQTTQRRISNPNPNWPRRHPQDRESTRNLEKPKSAESKKVRKLRARQQRHDKENG